MRFKKFLIFLSLVPFISIYAAPIRVGILMGEGDDGEDWHTSIHTAGTVIQSMLANPAGANLGPSLTIPAQGFTCQQFGDNDSIAFVNNIETVCHAPTPNCQPQSGMPTAQAITDFIHALDTLDVVVIPTYIQLGSSISDSASQAKFMNFASTKGFVSIHETNSDNKLNIWPAFNSLEASVFNNHPIYDRQATLKRDTLPQDTSDASFAFLNRSLNDTAFTDEWESFTQTAATIRATQYLKVTLTIDENSYVGGLGGATAMGDHPMSWYRNFPTGGRFFYTAIGHESQNMTTVANRFWRRQVYNAIVWSAKQDGSVTLISSPKTFKANTELFKTSIHGSSLIVSPTSSGSHTIMIQGLNGERLFETKGQGQQSHTFNLRSGSLYVVTVKSSSGQQEKIVAIE